MSPVASSSLKVGHLDDVQELRKYRPTAVPERYVREGAERPTVSALGEAPASMQIPVIDLWKLAHGGPYRARKELEKLSVACEDWGFFQVVNHGIDSVLLERMQRVSEEFFMLPLEEKEKYPMAPGTLQGYGHAFVFSEDQKLDWCNMLALGVEPPFIRNPKLWPTNPPKFRETLEAYSANVRKLSQALLRFIAMSLGLKPQKFNKMFGTAVQAVRMNYYPPCPRPDLVLGLSSHSDGSALTVLQQSMGPVGLQIVKGKTWVPIHPIRNALVINIGDTIEVLTNGRYKSVEHRAVTNKDRDRLSIVTFYAPSYEIELGPLPEFVDKNHPRMYRRYNHGEYSRHYINNKLDGKRSLEFAKIQNKS
ncbi:hypothetical protein H6P81_015078 [Aristolochia fimbriata]|uniref:Fe2OG dioxygenase domain-containing protein n=1 Tax=Aristolochia fimbriata TaxID=158543 RepID=A0AAV7E4G8_ARIFI|nr:hypothetical protein H6P81_015078 [Aristolochia fimbriata]